VEKKPTSENEWDRLLAQGMLAGPEADRLWERIAPKVTAVDPWWVRTFRRGGFLVPVLAAGVLVILLRPQETGEFRERAASFSVAVEATCGSANNPCRVGQPVYFHAVAPPDQDQVVLYVVIRDASGPSLLTGPTMIPQGPWPLNVKIAPETADVASGIELNWWVVGTPLPDPALLVRGQRPPNGTVTLSVRAPP
jgi:hypothetical protein